MRCIVCDRCKKIIEDPRRCRVITCARPLKFKPTNDTQYRGNDKQMNDIIWEKELCSDCLDELEQFMDTPPAADEPDAGDNGDTGDGDGNDGTV